ncbi:acetaldehyde dehydrogenase (acetylating) [Microbacterium thalassium]|uniref:Acetaldehyde dehydrogenase n=1 Tax=Microbacterium thalassium TaxID=362649 RepID=A0A7X0FLQ8_9MICO|nr:acetaldehyde dehydrogenase (acetylating) [Microbacterium thalassium]MBB6389814.1 acetaldehyde dehydrogenase [Microbacterium thalassium]GLK24502.1 acetaldehyde dehydrogenase [Microbacterium thalassium]
MGIKAAIIGPGNIGTDLMFKIIRLSDTLEMAAMVGIDPTSDGLARAGRLGFPTTHEGVKGLIAMPGFDEIDVVFDATSAGAHRHNAAALAPYGKLLIDLTPAAVGPYVVPVVNLDANLDAPDVNMVTCGGQATIPMVAAVSQVTPVHYAEIVASISSRSAGPGTRANIDEFTETTATGLEVVGGAARGKAIIILNPADPPMIMRDTVQVVVSRLDEAGRAAVAASVEAMAEKVRGYVPGYRLKQKVQFLDEGAELDGLLPEDRRGGEYTRVSVFLEVEGAAMYLPAYAGNLDIMTSAALKAAETLAAARQKEKVA